MITMLWFYSVKMTGHMTELRATIQDFDHPPETTGYIEAKKEFDDLHKTYTMFVGINMILITSVFVLSVVNTRAG